MKLTKPLFTIIAGLIVSLTGLLQAQVTPGSVSISGGPPSSPQNFGTTNWIQYTAAISNASDNVCETLHPSNTIVAWDSGSYGTWVTSSNNPAYWTNIFPAAGWYTNDVKCTVTFSGTDCNGNSYSTNAIVNVTNPVEVMPFLNIVVSGTTNTICAANSNNVAIVGQQINLSAQTFGGTFSNFQWTVAGNTFSNYIANSQTGMVVTTFPLTNSNVSFYWVDAGTNSVICSAVCAGISCITNAAITVVRPTATVTTITKTVNLDNFYGQPTLHFGTNLPAQTGIAFTNSAIAIPTGYYNSGNTNYNLEWVQIAVSFTESEQTNNVAGTWYTTGTVSNVLDTKYPYPNYPAGTSATVDSPHTRGLVNYKAVSRSDSFAMYLMFQPSGGQWVTLTKVGWNWSGSGTNSAGVWLLTSSNNSTNPAGFDTTTFPVWTDNVTNYYSLH